MKTIRTLLVLAGGCWGGWAQEGPPGELPTPEIYSTNAVQATRCTAQLHRIRDALAQYRVDHHQEWPQRLSQLVSDYLTFSDLRCPYVRESVTWGKYRESLRDEVWVERDVSYSYELVEEGLGLAVGEGVKATVREYKFRQQRLLEELAGQGDRVPVVRCFAHRPVLNLSLGGEVYGSGVEWEQAFEAVAGHNQLIPEALFAKELEAHLRAVKVFPRRAPGLDPRMLDLTPHYSATLTEPLHQQAGNDFRQLGVGSREIGGVTYDLRGLVQLRGTELPIYPVRAEGLPVNQTCRAVHLLHATAYPEATGVTVARVIVHYRSGEVREIPVVYGRDVADWWVDGSHPEASQGCEVAWEGSNPAAAKSNRPIRLYHTRWENPLPEVTVATLDYVSEGTGAAPFLVAVTLE